MQSGQPFEAIEPAAEDSPVLVEVPHAGLLLDPESLSWMAAPAENVARDADLYVDELFVDSPECGATLLLARMSRYVIDLNRDPVEYDDRTVVGGLADELPRGVLWRQTSDGHTALREPLPQDEYERRCKLYYWPYHDELTRILERKRARHGFAVLLSAHSMPTPQNNGKPVYYGQGPDIIPGTVGRTTAGSEWIDLVDRVARKQRWLVQHDVPYEGGYTTRHYGNPARNVHAIQIEIARRLYMNETRMRLNAEGFQLVRSFARQLVRELVDQARHSNTR